MNFKFCGAASYKFNQTMRHTIAPKQRLCHLAEISSQRRAWQTAEIIPQRYARQKIKIPSQWHARRSTRQAEEILLGQHIRQAARILQNRSLPCATKILLLRHTQGAEIASAQNIKILLPRYTPQAEISRAENCENSATMQQAASRRNFIEISRMMNHQIPAKNNKTLAKSREISAERGAVR